MKNTIILKSAILIAAVAFSAGQDLRAQNMKEPYKVENGIAYKKSVSQTPNENGEYTVTLETFITGEVSQKQKPIPADIVLVLDVSGSMRYAYSTADEYIETSSQDWSYSSFNGYGSGDRYYYYEGEYYLVESEYDEDYNYYYTYLYFTDSNNKRHYLYGNTIQDDRPTRPRDRSFYTVTRSTIYTGKLFRKNTTTTATRLEALQDAVEKFINVVKAKDSELKLKTGQVGNRVAIVKFAGDSYSGTKEEGDDTYRDGSNTYNYTQIVKKFHPVATDSQELINAVDAFTAAGATSVDYGLTKAHNLILNDGLPITDEKGETIRSRTVIVFTDGNPTHDNYFQYAVAASAVRTAKSIKATEGEIACSAKVFTVGVFGDDKDIATDEYMNRVSSNYEDADYTTYTENRADWEGNITQRGSITYTGDPISQVDDELIYSIIVGNDKGLDEVFEAIADISSGQNTSVGDDSLLNLDIISNSFKLPDGVEEEDIHVFTAQCLGLAVKDNGDPWLDEEGNQYLAFAEPIEAKGRPAVPVLWVRRTKTDADGKPIVIDGKIQYEWEAKEDLDIDNSIEFDFGEGTGEGDNFVSVTGFNYSDYWCGYDADHENAEQYNKEEYSDTYRPGYRGFKLIIQFPIIINPEAVGGPAVITNDENSGLYQTDEEGNPVGEALVHFNRPNVKIPVSIWIQKTGLVGNDNAVFTLARSKFDPDTFDPTNPGDPASMTWTNFTKIVVNNEIMKEVLGKDGKPILDKETGEPIKVVKISGLDPEYFYRIKEDAWAWSYEYQMNGTKYTVGEEELTNPIKFKNEKKDEIVKHDEAVVRNVFADPEGNVIK